MRSSKDLSPSEKIAFFQEKARALHTELGRPGELPNASASGADGQALREG